MTESEAIKELHKIRPRGGIIPQKRAEALDVAIQALEKQIPQKVQEKHIDEYICPACGEENSGCDEGKITDRYCPKCGQRLWG